MIRFCRNLLTNDRLYCFNKSSRNLVLNLNQKRFITDNDLIKNLNSNFKHIERTSSYCKGTRYILILLQKENYDEVKKIVQRKKINIDSHDHHKNTPLIDATKRGDIKAIKFLINEMNANVHASCDFPHCKTALHYATENDNAEAVKLLLDNGADPNIQDSRMLTAHDLATSNKTLMLIQAKGGVSSEDTHQHRLS